MFGERDASDARHGMVCKIDDPVGYCMDGAGRSIKAASNQQKFWHSDTFPYS